MTKQATCFDVTLSSLVEKRLWRGVIDENGKLVFDEDEARDSGEV